MQMQAYTDAIAEEKAAVASLAASSDIFDIKRELANLEVEAEYRRRIKQVSVEVKKRLDYQVYCSGDWSGITLPLYSVLCEKEVCMLVESWAC